MDIEKDVKYRLLPTPKTYEDLSDRQSVALLSKDLKRIATGVNNDLIARSVQTQTGTMSFTYLGLVNPVWDDTQQSSLALRDVGVNVPVITQYGTTGIYMPMFDVGDILAFSHQFSHRMAETFIVTVSPHLHWITPTTSANVVRWQMTYQWLNIGDTVSATSSVITVDGTPTADKWQLTSFPDISKEGARISSIVTGNLTRITNGGSNYTGDVFLDFFDIHFSCDSLGSDGVGTKTFPRY